jgi:hypothetical protein
MTGQQKGLLCLATCCPLLRLEFATRTVPGGIAGLSAW